MPPTAEGTFDVTITPQEQSAKDGQMPAGRFGLFKTFTGSLSGTAEGTMLSLGMPKPGTAAAYVALDWFSGMLDGRKGGFAMIHRGTMTPAGVSELDVRIAPASGTEQLKGIAGELTIDIRDGKHFYKVVYTLE